MARSLLDWLLILLALVIYVAGLQLNIMDVDSAQYASISQEMEQSGSYLEVKNKGQDYLDKPPLLFWTSALSFKLFGFHNWSFKLIPFLLALASIRATHRLGRLLADEQVGRWAAVMLGSCQAYFLFTLDLRTDTMLTACVAIAIAQIMEFSIGDGRLYRLISGFLFVGLAMLAKGPIGLMIPMIAIGAHFLFNREWKKIFQWHWLFGLLVTALVLAPMSYGLYTQFDQATDKSVLMPGPSGMTAREGISGLRFYFWEQSFGRITGENVWKDSSGPFFLVHNFLWSFAPWSFFACIGLFWKLRKELRSLMHTGKGDWLSLAGFLIPFVILSRSQFKLPHYIFPLFPFAALITAEFMKSWLEQLSKSKWSKAALYSLSCLTIASIGALGALVLFWVFPVGTPVRLLFALSFAGALALLILRPARAGWIRSMALASLGANLVMNMHFYPQLLRYQGGSELAAIARSKGATPESTVRMGQFSYSFDVYMETLVASAGKPSALKSGQKFVYTHEKGLKRLRSSKRRIAEEIVHEGYPITNLSADFLDPAKRPEALRKSYLVILEPEEP